MRGGRYVEDNKIVELFIKRDESAIKEVSIKYGNKLNNIAKNILDNISDAQECENDTYMDAWNSIPPNEPKNYLFAYLAKIIRSKALNYYKSRNTLRRKAIIVELSKELEECIAAPEADINISDNEVGKLISNFLRDQKEEARIIFVRRYWYVDSINNIAKMFNISESKVKSSLFRTRNKLRVYLEKEGIKYEG